MFAHIFPKKYQIFALDEQIIGLVKSRSVWGFFCRLDRGGGPRDAGRSGRSQATNPEMSSANLAGPYHVTFVSTCHFTSFFHDLFSMLKSGQVLGFFSMLKAFF